MGSGDGGDGEGAVSGWLPKSDSSPAQWRVSRQGAAETEAVELGYEELQRSLQAHEERFHRRSEGDGSSGGGSSKGRKEVTTKGGGYTRTGEGATPEDGGDSAAKFYMFVEEVWTNGHQDINKSRITQNKLHCT